eukprot:Gregarina_sp_Poly_1__5038@NODE_266_length_10382_cov_507_901212_g232_i0_p1_GENE_NODE_266_length_10382_cov_507_901212_g232_i0NODE_266_length_10382_cov_507_901212_g232_i0_p1_ORF_typecomplete_len660_score67_76_NODE_266_length_10382_cov_507_901212_g232_i02491982
MCGRKFCPAKFIAWLPLCILLIVFSLLFLAGLLIAFFLTNTTFALLDQEDVYTMIPWQGTTGEMLSYIADDPELGEIVLLDVQLPIVTYVPSLIPIRVVHYGLSVRYTPLTAISQKTLSSMCILNNLRMNRSVEATMTLCQQSMTASKDSAMRSLDTNVSMEEWLPFSQLLTAEHRSHVVDAFSNWIEALQPSAKHTVLTQANSFFGFLPRLRRTSLSTVSRKLSNTTRATARQGFTWPMETKIWSPSSSDHTIEVSWETSEKKFQNRYYGSKEKEIQLNSASNTSSPKSLPYVLDIISLWNHNVTTRDEKKEQEMQSISHHHVPRWRRRSVEAMQSSKRLNQTTTAKQSQFERAHEFVASYKSSKLKSPHDVRLAVLQSVSNADLSWWLTSLLLTRLQTCFEEASRLSNLMQAVGGMEELPADLHVTSSCGEQWAIGATLKSQLGTDTEAAKLADAALLASAAEDVSVDFTFPAQHMKYVDPLRSKVLPKGQFNLPPLQLYLKLPIATNPDFYAAMKDDCDVWGMVLLEVRFEDAYPCEWCSLIFRPHTYRYQFVTPCYVELVASNTKSSLRKKNG